MKSGLHFRASAKPRPGVRMVRSFIARDIDNSLSQISIKEPSCMGFGVAYICSSRIELGLICTEVEACCS